MKTDAEIGRANRERMLAQAARNRAAGDLLRSAVRSIWERHPDYKAKQVIRELKCERAPSERRVQELLKELRAMRS